MRIAFYLLIGLIGCSPAFSLFDGPIIHGLLAAYIALTVAIAGFSIRPGEAEHLFKLIRPVVFLAAIPLLWIVIQALPMPMGRLAPPLWSSASAALNQSVISSISVDRGATLIALARYCFVLGIFFIASAVTIDRVRAETALLWLAAITTVCAVLLFAFDIGILDAYTDILSAEARPSLAALAAAGIIANAAALVRAVERYETRRAANNISMSQLFRVLIFYVATFITCSVAVILCTTAQTIFAAACGFAAFAIIVIIRRVGLGTWANSFLVTIAAITVIIITIANSASGDLTLRFSSPAPSSIAMVQNILSNTGWAGNGAGTYQSILPIYSDFNGAASESHAPTTAATIVIELGRPAFWTLFTIALVFLGFLFRGSMQRGRDSFYATMGASWMVVVVLESFCDASLFGTTVLINLAAVLGLAVAQCASRAEQLRFNPA